jgi:hypothetical protein
MGKNAYLLNVIFSENNHHIALPIFKLSKHCEMCENEHFAASGQCLRKSYIYIIFFNKKWLREYNDLLFHFTFGLSLGKKVHCD